MKQHFIIKNNQKHLLLFFAGWGMDETPFLTIHPTDKDWMICYDYRSLAFDTDLLETYSQITLIAWSMGVWAASQIMKQYPHLPVSQSIAINGTLYPIHETKGIAHSIFDGTLQGLNEQTLQKFQRRMCGSIADYKTFQTISPQRPMEELKEELAAIQQQYLSLPPSDFKWQKATAFSSRITNIWHGKTKWTLLNKWKRHITNKSFLTRYSCSRRTDASIILK